MKRRNGTFLAAAQGDKTAIEDLKKMEESGTLPARCAPDDISADKMYQAHGDHLNAIMDAEKLIMQHLRTILEEAKLFKTAETLDYDRRNKGRTGNNHVLKFTAMT